jgi:hypothetical protein
MESPRRIAEGEGVASSMNFKEFFGQQQDLDSSQIERQYDKARISVELVRMYRPEFLENISTIADLASGAYGLYNSGENKKILPPDYEQRLIYWGKVKKDQIGAIPTKMIKQYFPDLDERKIRSGDTVHVNVRRILSQARSDVEAVLQIASTIVHEATHRIERETKGQTFETGPKGEEQKFMNWAMQNLQMIIQKYPELGGQPQN